MAHSPFRRAHFGLASTRISPFGPLATDSAVGDRWPVGADKQVLMRWRTDDREGRFAPDWWLDVLAGGFTAREMSDHRPMVFTTSFRRWAVDTVDGAKVLELDIRQARWVRWRVPVVVAALLLPFVGLAGVALFAGAAAFGWFTRRSRRCRGEDYRLDIAVAAGLCWIPLLTLLGSVGTGWGF